MRGNVKCICMKYTIYIERNEDGWLTGQCEQLPQAISQGANVDDLMENMKDAIELVLAYQREKFLEKYKTVEEYSVKNLTIRHETIRSIKASHRKRVFEKGNVITCDSYEDYLKDTSRYA